MVSIMRHMKEVRKGCNSRATKIEQISSIAVPVRKESNNMEVLTVAKPTKLLSNGKMYYRI
jgi:hypothetical protein